MPEKILGLDIGAAGIKAVQVTTGFKGYQITGSVHVDIAEAGGMENALAAVFDNEQLRSGIYITSLPAGEFSFRDVRLPFTDRKKIQQTLAYEMEQLLPYPIDDMLVDSVIRDQHGDSDILAAAVLKDVVERRVHCLEAHHAEAAIIEIDPVSVALRLIEAGDTEGTTLLLDIGVAATGAVLYSKGRIRQIRSFTFGGATLTEAVARALMIDVDDAETRKCRNEIEGAESEVRAACGKLFDQLRNMLAFLRMRGELEEDLTGIALTGGGARSAVFQDELTRFFDVPVERADLRTAENVQGGEGWDPLLMNQALALATRESRKGTGFNFGTGEFEPRHKYEKFKKEFRWAAVFIIAILCLWGTDFYIDYHRDRVTVDALKTEIVSEFREAAPDVTRIVDPLHQLRVKIDEARKSSMGGGVIGTGLTVLDMLQDISRTVPKETDFLIASFTFDGKSIEIKGETDNFNAVDSIKNSLAESSYFTNITISSAKLIKQESRVGFDLKMELKKG